MKLINCNFIFTEIFCVKETLPQILQTKFFFERADAVFRFNNQIEIRDHKNSVCGKSLPDFWENVLSLPTLEGDVRAHQFAGRDGIHP